MDLAKVLIQLRAELENLNIAIASLEKLASHKRANSVDEAIGVKRPGRPRKNPAVAAALGVQKRGVK